MWGFKGVKKVAEGVCGGRGAVCVEYLGARCVNHVSHWSNPIKTERCGNLGELHKNMTRGILPGSSTEALAF